MQRHQTSYGALVLVMLMTGLLIFGVTSNTFASNPNTISITGVVPAVPPTTRAMITNPTSGQTFSSIPIAVDGTCQAGIPVKVFKNGLLAGSAMCGADSKFHLSIDLFEGKNDLTAQVFDLLGQSGPISPTVTVYYSPAPQPSPAPSISPSATSAASPKPKPKPTIGPISPTPSPTILAGQLMIKTDTPYHGVFVNDILRWPIEIVGGVAPYAVSWDWGDGRTDLISRNEASGFYGEHTYDRFGTYTIIVRVTDSDGHTAYLQMVTVVHQGVGVGATTASPTFFDRVLPLIWPIYLLVMLLLVSFWVGEIRERRLMLHQIAVGAI